MLACATPSYAQHQTLQRVTFQGIGADRFAHEIKLAGFDVLEDSVTEFEFSVIGSSQELSRLYAPHLRRFIAEFGSPLRERVAVHRGDGPLNGYPDLDQVLAQMNAIAAQHPDIAQVINVTAALGAPTTVEGRSLFALKVSDNVAQREDEPAVLIVSTHHARETVTPLIALEAMQRLTEGYGSDAAITAAVDANEIIIAPVWNPDGYVHVFEVDNLWRKNRRVFSNGIGVDQNRNYPQGWDAPCGGSSFPSSQTFRGDAPASEAETLTMMALTDEYRFAKVIDFHSFGREVLHSYSCSNHPFSDWFMANASALSVASGYAGALRFAGAEGEHYQWQLAQRGAWSHLIETSNVFQPPIAEAISEAQQLFDGILFALNEPISLTGVVTDALTGEGIEAHIELPQVPFEQGESNQSGGPFGRYHFALPAGSYEVRYQRSGYQTQTFADIAIPNNGNQVVNVALQPLDSDNDGIVDLNDNCTILANADQRDTNGDGFGNVCDADLNNDLSVNFEDLGLLRAAFFSANDDADLSGDGVVNFIDLGLMRSGFFLPPGPSGPIN